MGLTLYDYCVSNKRTEQLSYWHSQKNGSLTPRGVTHESRRKVWWRCACGHEWLASVQSLTSGKVACPSCSGKLLIPGETDLASTHPQLAAQWHPTRNNLLRADAVTPLSTRKVWWICDKGHEYQAQIHKRAGEGDGCPYCEGKKVLAGFNDLATENPELAAQWHPTLNEGLTPEMVCAASHRKVWWRCSEGHAWKAIVNSRVSPEDSGCPFCSGKVNLERPGRYKQILEIQQSEQER